MLLVSLLLDMYRGAFARIYVFSPSVDIDAAWRPVKEYIEKDLGVDEKKKPYSSTPGTLKLYRSS